MYEYLKDLLPVAELVGEPLNIRACSGDEILGDEVRITGVTDGGRKFCLQLSIEEGDKE